MIPHLEIRPCRPVPPRAGGRRGSTQHFRRQAALLWALAMLAVVASGSSQVSSEKDGVAPASAQYLVLDVATPRLRLMHGGALLRDYPVAGIEIGRPAAMLIPRGAIRPSAERTWRLDRLDPARTFTRPIVYPAAPGAKVESVEIPPLPEEQIPAPDRYFLRFEGGLAIEVVQQGRETDPAWRAWPRALGWWLRELGESISWRPEVRLRLVLSKEDAGALYRSLPLSLDLVVQ